MILESFLKIFMAKPRFKFISENVHGETPILE